jgi:26S proteasome regulatory subunit T5
MVIGDGAKLVRDAFELAKEKAPAIIFIDELDAIGTKRFDSEKSGATMLELLNRLDGFSSDENIKGYIELSITLVGHFASRFSLCIRGSVGVLTQNVLFARAADPRSLGCGSVARYRATWIE